MKALAETSGETVHLSECIGDRLATIHVEESPRAHRVIVDVGTYLPFHATASGLAFLAFSESRWIDEILSRPLKSFTSHTVTEAVAVRRLLEETLERGFSICDQGLEAGVISTGAAIRSPSGQPIGSIAIAAPMARAGADVLMALGASAIEAAKSISETYYGSERPSGTGLQTRGKR